MASPPSPQALLAPYYFGVLLNTFLYGILVIQTLFYYQHFKHDKLWLRSFVLYLFLVETLNTGICVANVQEPLVGQFGTDLPIQVFPSLLPSQPFLEAAVFVPVHFFYAWRIWIIMRSLFVPTLICMASVTSLIGACWTAIIVTQAKTYANKPKIDHTALVWSCSAAAADIMITTSLIWSLQLKKTGTRRTDDLINKILKSTIQTGGLTVAFTILDVALFVALPNSTLSFVFDFAIPKLYSNALISTFNGRLTGLPPAVDIASTVPPNNMLFLGFNDPHSDILGLTHQEHGPSTTAGEFTDAHSDMLDMNSTHQEAID
ncbi:hypothetical protein K438DRAFT_1961751 [Mycena galopus ATCC 62051]|nr:hypothetical protein K438DRAFT_1961751 [Mycena galopus ATCC 62051]